MLFNEWNVNVNNIENIFMLFLKYINYFITLNKNNKIKIKKIIPPPVLFLENQSTIINHESDCHDTANVLARTCCAEIGFYKTRRAFKFRHN